MTSFDLGPAHVDLRLYAGDGEAGTVTIVDRTSGDPVDVSGRAWTSQWRPTRWADDAAAITLPVDVSRANVGVVVVHFPAAATRAMAGTGVWDLQSVPTGGEPETLLGGDVTVEQDVTR